MSNSYFQFKQFRVEQGRVAMKVTTDACILGAWTPVLPHVKRVLDVGAGTGLLSLMLAQRSNEIVIDAIELDNDAAVQARENVAASEWAGRINIIEGSVVGYDFKKKYDLIISNPPFFNNSLLSGKDSRNMARHTASLSYAELLIAIDDHLGYGGYASVLLPVPEYEVWKGLLDAGNWLEHGKLSISHRPGAAVKRVVCLFGKSQLAGLKEEALVIQDNEGKYTPEFTGLLAPYYLDL